MKYLLVLILISPFFCKAQKVGDTKITVTVADSIDLYKKVKIVLVNYDFIVKDNYNYDTLTTYSKEFTNINGQCRIMAVINKNTVTFSGIYGLKQIDDWGYTQNPKNMQNIIYYKGSKGWALLRSIAEKLGDKFEFRN